MLASRVSTSEGSSFPHASWWVRPVGLRSGLPSVAPRKSTSSTSSALCSGSSSSASTSRRMERFGSSSLRACSRAVQLAGYTPELGVPPPLAGATLPLPPVPCACGVASSFSTRSSTRAAPSIALHSADLSRSVRGLSRFSSARMPCAVKRVAAAACVGRYVAASSIVSSFRPRRPSTPSSAAVISGAVLAMMVGTRPWANAVSPVCVGERAASSSSLSCASRPAPTGT